jgi:plasmid stabilization system protein ParE
MSGIFAIYNANPMPETAGAFSLGIQAKAGRKGRSDVPAGTAVNRAVCTRENRMVPAYRRGYGDGSSMIPLRVIGCSRIGNFHAFAE